MELIIVLVIVAGIIGLLYFRSKGTAQVEKVEETHAWPATEHTVPVTEPEPPVVAAVTEPVAETPVAVPEVVAKPKKARTKKATTDSAKPAESKPAAKPRAKKPKMSVAK